ncbi:hypothetical protein ACWGIP_34155, partial [Streptomyces sp. NPDC054838]
MHSRTARFPYRALTAAAALAVGSLLALPAPAGAHAPAGGKFEREASGAFTSPRIPAGAKVTITAMGAGGGGGGAYGGGGGGGGGGRVVCELKNFAGGTIGGFVAGGGGGGKFHNR